MKNTETPRVGDLSWRYRNSKYYSANPPQAVGICCNSAMPLSVLMPQSIKVDIHSGILLIHKVPSVVTATMPWQQGHSVCTM